MLVETNPEFPEPRKIRRAVDALEAGQVIAYPTDTSYGIGADVLNRKAIDQIYAIKRMDRAHPVAFVCDGLAEIAKYAVVDKERYRILRHFLPGPYCFILEATREVPKLLQSKRKTIGIRVPAHPIPIALVRELGRPIVTSTACLPGGEPLIDSDEIDDVLKGLGLVLDGGIGGKLQSTVVDLTGDTAVIVREGAGEVDAFLSF